MPYIECILSNVWQRRQMSMNLSAISADSNEQHVSGREEKAVVSFLVVSSQLNMLDNSKFKT